MPTRCRSSHLYTLAPLMLLPYHGIPRYTIPLYHTIPYHTSDFMGRMDSRHLVASLLSRMSPGSPHVCCVLRLCIMACLCMHARLVSKREQPPGLTLRHMGWFAPSLSTSCFGALLQPAVWWGDIAYADYSVGLCYTCNILPTTLFACAEWQPLATDSAPCVVCADHSHGLEVQEYFAQ